ncbi:MAG: hypothetical protein HPZ91_18930 [Lentisphaeria bacterium]|nr:hypothetical protein [Lentisphaeria bacterium]
MVTASSTAFDAFLKNNDFSSPATILSLFLVVLIGIFIFLFNAMAMRRKQLDRQIHYIAAILARRRQIAEKLLDADISLKSSSMSAQVTCDEAVAPQIAMLDPDVVDTALRDEYRKLGEALTNALPGCRAELEHYNRLVEKPDTRWFTRLCRFKPREQF